MPGMLTNGLPVAAFLSARFLSNLDTELPKGMAPQSVSANIVQIAGSLLECINNEQTAVGTPIGTATMNTLGGVIITPSLFMAPGQTYQLTLSNNLITAQYIGVGGNPVESIWSIGNTGGTLLNTYPPVMSALMELESQTVNAGSVTWIWENMGNTALNGTMAVVWHL